MTDQTNKAKRMLNEHRVLQFSLILLVLAFALIAYMAYLNAQLRQQTQVALLDEYTKFISHQFVLARYEKTFEVRQKYYTQFMSGLEDSWYHMSRKNQDELTKSLHQLAKSYYGLEPFLDAGGRHYLQKRLAVFHETAKRLANPEFKQGATLDDKAAVNGMIEDFQNYLYPLIFESAQGAVHEKAQTDQ